MATTETSRKALQALMKNEKLSKIIYEGIDAPVGSTKRKRAQQILSIVNKTAPMDGSGGPSFNYQRSIPQENKQKQKKIVDYSNFYVFNDIPKQRIPFGKKSGRELNEIDIAAKEHGITLDGSGGGETYSLGNFGTTPMTPQSPILNSTSPVTPQSTDTKSPGFFSGLLNAAKTVFGGKIKEDVPAANEYTTSPYSVPTWNKKTTSTATTPSSFSLGTTVPKASTYTPIQGVNRSVNETATPSQGNISDQEYTGDTSSVSSQAYTETGGTSTEETLASKYPSLQTIVDSGMGPQMFANQALNNPDYLKTLPGFEGFSEDALNGGASLSGRVQKLSETLKDSYHLDELLNQQMNLSSQGVGLKGRLTDYIRGRDEFLNKTDSMLEDYKDQMLKMNLSDPQVRKSAEMYSNYLYELRGRQNKRYVEFLNTSIDEYNTKMKSAETMYSTALTNYQQALTTGAAITQEEYNLMHGALTDMYTQTQNAPALALESEKAQYELQSARLKYMKDAAELNGGQSLEDAMASLKKMGVITEEGTLNPNASLSDIATFAGNNISSNLNYLQSMMIVGKQSLTKPDKDGMTPSYDSIMKTGKSMLDTIEYFKQSGQLDNDYASGYINQIKEAMASAIYGNGTIGADKSKEIKAVVNYLSGTGGGWFSQPGDNSWLPFNMGKSPTKEQLLAEAKSLAPSLDSSFLDLIYKSFAEYGDENREQFSKDFLNDQDGVPLDDASLASRLASMFTDNISGSAGNYTGSTSFNIVGGDTDTASGLVGGYDITSYATDPTHEVKVASIYNKISNLSTAAQVDSYIRSIAPNSPVTGSDVIYAANAKGVSPGMILAIMQQDSTFGTAGKAVSTKNPGNVGNTDSGATRSFSTWRDGVLAVAENLAKRKVA